MCEYFKTIYLIYINGAQDWAYKTYTTPTSMLHIRPSTQLTKYPKNLKRNIENNA